MERNGEKRKKKRVIGGKIVRKGIKEKSWKKSFECRICTVGDETLCYFD